MATKVFPWSKRPRGGRDCLKAGNFLHGRRIVESSVAEDHPWDHEKQQFLKQEGRVELTFAFCDFHKKNENAGKPCDNCACDKIHYVPDVETPEQCAAEQARIAEEEKKAAEKAKAGDK